MPCNDRHGVRLGHNMRPRNSTNLPTPGLRNIIAHAGHIILCDQCHDATAESTTNLAGTIDTDCISQQRDQTVRGIATDFEIISQTDVLGRHLPAQSFKISGVEGSDRISNALILTYNVVTPPIQNLAKAVGSGGKLRQADVPE